MCWIFMFDNVSTTIRAFYWKVKARLIAKTLLV